MLFLMLYQQFHILCRDKRSNAGPSWPNIKDKDISVICEVSASASGTFCSITDDLFYCWLLQPSALHNFQACFKKNLQ